MRADACRRVWPAVIRQVLELNNAGHHPFDDRYFGDMALARSCQRRRMVVPVLRGRDGPDLWTDPLAWRDEIDEWLKVAAGNPHGVDSLIGLLRSVPVADQVDAGLPWCRPPFVTSVPSPAAAIRCRAG